MLLLCPPDYFGIEYEINPWMHKERGADRALARAQWQRLYETLLELKADVELVGPQPGLPDMVFTANAGLVVGERAILSNFRHPERQREAAHFARWFEHRKLEVVRLPDDLFFEGEGDALFCGDVLFCGYRFRSDIRSRETISELLHCLVVSVELVDNRFYHLDTCFCPLPDGGAVWFPAAFDDYARNAIRQHVRELIDVTEEEATRFACNAIVLGRDIVLPEGCAQLEHSLRQRGYHLHALPMGEFLKSGGACKCLTLFVPQR
ncbi:MAG: arginine deiminase-related protein [Verrucomicrobiota bacterium]